MYIGLGAAFGLLAGVLFDRVGVALGLCFGAAFGVIVGIMSGAANAKSKSN
jgi:hypothetical protein